MNFTILYCLKHIHSSINFASVEIYILILYLEAPQSA